MLPVLGDKGFDDTSVRFTGMGCNMDFYGEGPQKERRFGVQELEQDWYLTQAG